MKVEDIKRICEAATPGPWVEKVYTCECCACVEIGNTGKSIMYVLDNLPAVHSGTDATFIAMARTMLPKLVKVAEAVKTLSIAATDIWESPGGDDGATVDVPEMKLIELRHALAALESDE